MHFLKRRRLSLVAGGAGFIGSHLVEKLLARGDDVIIVDNLSKGSLTNISRAITGGRATFIYLDIATTTDKIRPPILKASRGRRINVIFHLASSRVPDAGGTIERDHLQANFLGTMSLIDIALEHSARFTYSSSVGDLFDEEQRLGELAVADAVARRGLDGRIVRFPDFSGPRKSSTERRLFETLAEAGKAFQICDYSPKLQSSKFVQDAIRRLLVNAEMSNGDLRL